MIPFCTPLLRKFFAPTLILHWSSPISETTSTFAPWRFDMDFWLVLRSLIRPDKRRTFSRFSPFSRALIWTFVFPLKDGTQRPSDESNLCIWLPTDRKESLKGRRPLTVFEAPHKVFCQVFELGNSLIEWGYSESTLCKTCERKKLRLLGQERLLNIMVLLRPVECLPKDRSWKLIQVFPIRYHEFDL